ncbi:bifunctional phosphopantothenoylcysteine decarboxylase/phosphopantothenate--cysteine ligase CoaBC [Cellvibrio japonicus]|uniref:bifunctional phosphopantothenoylcysteine decarboxylase/phosphopantothenate--cysteine ligase CoaBC n=1 Tax=Cellvibrio japonicus TaxID=155077 RepID=UPI000A2F3262|nr:bifunctional phosphopantothenoylcysteine decarboxylase/phosphopantothenate--cysteine ligase CoaBC [Cellvibrio japonicus]QEI14321.1 bifunctional phosphopantothenoylcysteine decarboxylase/phosphopantothenate--cysteine ligase CoaBC [Cellvibrio japonicus]QEI17898.1 bifunctional phosphopantothenoylcysteine decarboxylase/phosphopantothenate--cysteine ligase CoaBC [Cellvibrio japonicus]QEI21474.1 bifunctional phosphopantothenoylcysteine decarboxylase/phosphopantothenate--cysteine ligase CoaBC [Cellv
MLSLYNKHILLGVTGGIAAYKSAELVRRLQDAGAQVQVVMTPAAQEFITPLTLQALSGNPVHTQLLDPEAEAGMGHIQLARWADLVLVAPATADFIARLAQGMGNDLLTSICLATAAPLTLAPAMNQGMWRNQSTQANVNILRDRGIQLFGPTDGSQACGDIGPGRMLEPTQLVEAAAGLFQTGLLAGKKVVITAGPTREAIDPVRYISNHSSGKMGYALAEAAAEAGAHTLLISGPTQLPCPARVTRIDVVSAVDMFAASLREAADCDLFIASAAVADYRPREVAEQKIKKGEGESITLTLVKNPDIVAAVARLPQRPFTVGFAAESEHLVEYARRKLVRKKLDLVIANDITQPGIGFNSDNNAVTLVDAAGEQVIDQRSKTQLARELVTILAEKLASSSHHHS